ncbi:MAG: FAD-binding oxidoreductase [Gammaproteobacteria bacterium]|nr:FAD-binding oxidoreductase [Gammaproteobacteria bacterium]
MRRGLQRALEEIFTPARVRTAPEDLATWGGDWTRAFKVAPGAIVFPRSIDEVGEVTRLANTRGLHLVPSGGRTGLSGGAVASNGEIVVSFDRMNRMLDFNAADRVVRCEAGVVTQALQEYAAARNLFYPVDFASSGSSQIGGNISTNAGGIKVIRYGLTRDWVVGLTVVTGAGDVLECNNALVKNATGYDLRHLFIGAEGTLGFVVQADIRLLTAPAPARVMVLAIDRFADILDVLQCFRDALTLSAFEFFSELALTKVLSHREVSRPFARAANFYALIEFDADDEEAALRAFETAVERGWVGDGVISRSDAQARALWTLRDGITESIAPYTPYKNDIAVRVSDVPAFLEDIDRLVSAHYPDFEVCWFGHIGDGNLHLNILKPENLASDAFYERCHRISPALFEAIGNRGGSISAEHGVGLLKRDFLHYSRSPQEIALMRQLKAVFDPNGVMNPGKLLRPLTPGNGGAEEPP